tara:strand:+ start:754 stop:1107 length:354 start_codon:yes stop_codon:yes gene_type:complete
MSSYKFTDDNHGIRIIEVIEFDDNQYFDDFIAKVSELLWGDSGAYEKPNGEIVCPREPYSVEETLERLRQFSDESLAWNELAMWCGAGDHLVNHNEDSDDKMELREFMDSIMKEVKQ